MTKINDIKSSVKTKVKHIKINWSKGTFDWGLDKKKFKRGILKIKHISITDLIIQAKKDCYYIEALAITQAYLVQCSKILIKFKINQNDQDFNLILDELKDYQLFKKLYQFKLIDKNLFNKIDGLRRKRNSFSHDLEVHMKISIYEIERVIEEGVKLINEMEKIIRSKNSEFCNQELLKLQHKKIIEGTLQDEFDRI